MGERGIIVSISLDEAMFQKLFGLVDQGLLRPEVRPTVVHPCFGDFIGCQIIERYRAVLLSLRSDIWCHIYKIHQGYACSSVA
jgi:hypothetical protein